LFHLTFRCDARGGEDDSVWLFFETHAHAADLEVDGRVGWEASREREDGLRPTAFGEMGEVLLQDHAEALKLLLLKPEGSGQRAFF
jgi:hypothetical protein